MMGTQLLWMSMPFVDNIMVGRLGREPLAAMGICVTYYTFFLVTAIGILSALNPLISQSYGAKQFEKIGPYVQSGIALALIYSIILILSLLFAKPALILLGQDPKLIEIGMPFLKAIAIGIPAQIVFLVFRQYCDAIGFPKPVIVMASIAAFTNIFLDYALIHGWGIFPKLGVAGAGVSTSSLNWLLAIGLFLFTKYHPRFHEYKVWDKYSISTKLMKEILVLGSPLAGGILAEVGYFSGSTWIAGIMGTTETAAHQVALNVASIAFMIPLGLSFAVSVKLGHAAGAGEKSQIKLNAKLGIQNAIALALFNATILFVFAHSIAGLYTQDPETKNLTVLLLRVAGFFQIFDGLQCLGIHALRGLKDTRVPFLFSMISYWVVGMSLSLLLGFTAKLGVLGIWYGMILALVLAAYLNLSRLRSLAFTN